MDNQTPRKTNLHSFCCTGFFEIDSSLMTHKNWSGDVVSFTDKNGNEIDLCIGLRVTSNDNQFFVFDESEMTKLGFESLDYEDLIFEPQGDENPNETD